jgi:hypothetical protein
MFDAYWSSDLTVHTKFSSSYCVMLIRCSLHLQSSPMSFGSISVTAVAGHCDPGKGASKTDTDVTTMTICSKEMTCPYETNSTHLRTRAHTWTHTPHHATPLPARRFMAHLQSLLQQPCCALKERGTGCARSSGTPEGVRFVINVYLKA